MSNLIKDQIVKTIVDADDEITRIIRDAEEKIAELQEAREELETEFAKINVALSGEKKRWTHPLFQLCHAIPYVKEKYDKLDFLKAKLRELQNQISDDALDEKRRSLIGALNQKIQALAANGRGFQAYATSNCKFEENFLTSVSKNDLFHIIAGQWKLTFMEESLKKITLPLHLEEITLPPLPHCLFPHIIEFPFDKPFYGELQKADSAIRSLLLQLLFSLPIGAVELTVIDPLNLGRSFLSFMPLRSIERLVQDNWCLTRSQAIESALSDLCNYLESLLQEKQIARWSRYDKNGQPVTEKDEYGNENEISSLPYKLVLIYGFPEQFSDNSIIYLKRILEVGPLLGVLPVVLFDPFYNRLLTEIRSSWSAFMESVSSGRFDTAMELSVKYGQKLEEAKRHCGGKSADILVALHGNGRNIITGDFPERLRTLKCEVIAEQEPKPKDLDQYVHWVSSAYKERLRFKKNIEKDVWGSVIGSGSTLKSISALIGWDVEGKEVEIRFEDAVSHALIGGVSGGGKSNLLHVIIHNLIHKYSAEELNIYLLDYKGTEFQYYSGIAIPQIKLVTQMMDREDGVMILDHLVKENDKRMEEFNKVGVNSIQKYREKYPDKKMPRIVVIIDEFHTMFEERDKLADKSSLGLEKLLRKGRSQGIHVLLATQTLKGLHEHIMKFKDQLACRIALRCSEEDSPAILGNSSNNAASKLPLRTRNEPREGILNESSGSSLENKRFSIPYINHELNDDGQPGNGKVHLPSIAKYYTQTTGGATDMKVINGQELPPLTNGIFSSTALALPEIILGQELCYMAEPFTFKWNRSNLCLAVPTENEFLPVRQAIVRSLLTCVRQHQMFDNIVYYKADENSRFDISDIQGIQDRTLNGDISGMVADFTTKRSLLIVDTLEAAEMFHPSKQAFGAKKDENSETTPAELLKKLLEEGSKNGSFVLAFVGNWKHFSDIYKSYLDLFGFRVGYGLNEKDAGGLVNDIASPTIKDKGFVNGTKAVFVDIKRGKTQLFRPFVVNK